MNAYKILIVDDDPRILQMTKMILENRDYVVVEAKNGHEALLEYKSESPDLILMDVMMPIMDGFEACKAIREISSVPIIMLTAKGEDYDQVNGLGAGADDYIVKPFTPIVLVARIEAVLRRTASKSQEQDTLGIGQMEIQLGARTVRIGGQVIDLNKKEFDLLVYMAQNAELSLSRDQILENVWGYDYLGSESTVDTHINRLRNKLGVCSTYLKTVRGYGYKLEG